MIQFVTRQQLDLAKYKACIDQAQAPRIYAQAWFLDAVCSTWNVLVKDDYSAVMPLPSKRKFGLNYIYLAPWIQQLGIFGPQEVSAQLMSTFIRAIPVKFIFVELMLNAANPVCIPNCNVRINYVLPLNQPYKDLYKAYSKGRKSSIKQAQQAQLKLDWKSPVSALIHIFKEGSGQQVSVSLDDYGRLEKLIKEAETRNLVRSLGVQDAQGQLLGGAVFLKDHTRWVYLFSGLTETGRKTQAMSFLLDGFIQAHSTTEEILDFEGSMIPGIASFFKSFGATQEAYGHYKRFFRL